MEIFRHFDTDIASTHYQGTGGFLLIDKILNAIGVWDISQCENPIQTGPFEIWPKRSCPRSQNKLIIAFIIYFARFKVFYIHNLCHRVNCDYLVFSADVYVESLMEAFRGLHRQISFVGYFSADVIRQTAVCK